MNNWLYTYELAGKSYGDDGVEYEMVLVSHWSDRTENAKEVGKKCFYFIGKTSQIKKLLDTEIKVRNLFYDSNYAKFRIVEKVEAKRIYE